MRKQDGQTSGIGFPLSRRLTLLERTMEDSIREDSTLSSMSPHMDLTGVIQFPVPEDDSEPEVDVEQFAADIDAAHREWQDRDVAEIEATDVALDLARDFIATTERRGLWGDGSWTAPARQAVDLLAQYLIWRLNNRNGSSPPAKFTGNDDG